MSFQLSDTFLKLQCCIPLAQYPSTNSLFETYFWLSRPAYFAFQLSQTPFAHIFQHDFDCDFPHQSRHPEVPTSVYTIGPRRQLSKPEKRKKHGILLTIIAPMPHLRNCPFRSYPSWTRSAVKGPRHITPRRVNGGRLNGRPQRCRGKK
jgi:hypothetical protein